MKITYVVDRNPRSYGPQGDARIRSHLLDALVATDAAYLKRNPEATGKWKLVEQRTAASPATWHDIPTVLRQGWGNYEDIASWKASEALLAGMPLPEFGYRGLPSSGRLIFEVDRFSSDPGGPPADQGLDHETLDALLHALTQIDVDYLALHPETPGIYDLHSAGKMRYQAEPEGQEDWLDIPSAMKLKEGDCEDIACWRAAELNVKFGVTAEPTFIYQAMADGGTLYHIQTLYPNGVVEDACRKLGMV